MTSAPKFTHFAARLEMLCRECKVSLGVLAAGNLVVMDLEDDPEPFLEHFCVDGTIDPDARRDQ